MRLVSVEFTGYKRFSATTDSRLNVDGKVIAIVGPNEAGKTSILDGLMALNDEERIPAVDRTRNEPGSELAVIRARYWLEESDRSAIRKLTAEPDQQRWFEVVKDQDGELRPVLVVPILRDQRSRHDASERMQALARHEWLRPLRTAEHGPLRAENFDEVAQALASTEQRLGDGLVERLKALAANLKGNWDSRAPKYVRSLIKTLEDLVESESTHPQDQAEALLLERRPRFVKFDQAKRQLRHLEDLNPQSEAPSPTAAFMNLTRAAGFDVKRYLQFLTQQPGDAAYALEQANARLKERFAAWTQSGVRPRIHKGDGTTLQVHVDREAGGYMKIDERSQGLRIFIALVALLLRQRQGSAQIVLIDEAETHLHYDAQADLVRVFAAQDSASQIIYTTHSAGCLPEDLGSGVRIVDPVPDTNHSRIRNKFWTDEPGFSPLLLGMGASTLAFFPTREAVVCEGATEMIMLGSLLREATGRPELGYQIAPGGATAKPMQIGGLNMEAPNVAWLVDGDGDGRKLRRYYIDQGVSPTRIVIAGGSGSGLVIEDFVDRDIYLEAINTELGRRRQKKQMPPSRLSSRNRPGSVDIWCREHRIRKLSKVEVAHHVVLEQREQHRKIVEASRLNKLRELDARLLSILGVDVKNLAPSRPVIG